MVRFDEQTNWDRPVHWETGKLDSFIWGILEELRVEELAIFIIIVVGCKSRNLDINSRHAALLDKIGIADTDDRCSDIILMEGCDRLHVVNAGIIKTLSLERGRRDVVHGKKAAIVDNQTLAGDAAVDDCHMAEDWGGVHSKVWFT